jgi:hypothetical protein
VQKGFREQEPGEAHERLETALSADLKNKAISITPLLGTGSQSLCARFTNMTPRPLLDCRYCLSNLVRWSDVQKQFLITSKPIEPIYVPGPKTLEPETPEGFELLSNRGNRLFFSGWRNDRHTSFEVPAATDTIWRIIISVSSAGRVTNQGEIFFKVVDSRELEIVTG